MGQRIFREATRRELGRKLSTDEAPRVSLHGLDPIEVEVESFGRGDRELDVICERRKGEDPARPIEFAACEQETGDVFLINTEGYAYARYLGRLQTDEASHLKAALSRYANLGDIAPTGVAEGQPPHRATDFDDDQNGRGAERLSSFARPKRNRHGLGLQLLEHSYQRNGISGEGFYSCRVHLPAPIAQTLIATIGHAEDGERFDSSNCRVIDPSDLTSHWRGDQIGDELAPLLAEATK